MLLAELAAVKIACKRAFVAADGLRPRGDDAAHRCLQEATAEAVVRPLPGLPHRDPPRVFRPPRDIRPCPKLTWWP
jgi:hypothetical protein